MLANRIVWVVAIVATSVVLLDALFESWLFRWAGKTGHRSEFADSGKARPIPDTDHTPPLEDGGSVLYTVELPLDHGDLQFGNFSNRYWVNSRFYRPRGPVFLYDVGESSGERPATKFLSGAGSFLEELLEEFHGIGIVWEHRYYGHSLPYPIDQNTTPDALRFLTVDQALADIPYFAQQFRLSEWHDQDLTPTSTPWIMLGCSYSGMRAAVARQRYPGTIFAAYAASAPVQLQTELNTFFDPVYLKMVRNGYGNCTRDLHAVMQSMDQQLSDAHNASFFKQRLLGPGAEVNDNSDFALAVANIYSNFQSSGLGSTPQSLAALCNYLEYDPKLRKFAGAAGLAARYGAEYVVDKLSRWPEFLPLVNSHFNTSCNRDVGQKLAECDLGQRDSDADSVSWTWQLCSELGLFATHDSNSEHPNLVSQHLSLDYRRLLCARQFPPAKAGDGMMPLPFVERINQVTGGAMMRPSNVFWTSGEYDPWRVLSPLAPNLSTSNGTTVTVTSTLSAYNVSTDASTVFGYLLRDAEHCHDYSLGSAEARKAQTYFRQALKEWLPRFEKGRAVP